MREFTTLGKQLLLKAGIEIASALSIASAN
jgi:hypothetical protein